MTIEDCTGKPLDGLSCAPSFAWIPTFGHSKPSHLQPIGIFFGQNYYEANY